jgi:membrane-associated PAP2 superfamily phosphatase
MPAAASSRARAAAALALAACLLVVIGQFTDLDLRLADAAYDVQTQAFPLRHAWLTERFNHGLLRTALVGLGMGMLLLAAWDGWRPLPWGSLRRRQLRVVALAAALIPALVALLKQASSSHCPWDLQRYGGVEPYLRLLDPVPAGVAAGHCMPGGHASSALWLAAFAVFFLPARPRLAWAAGALLMGAGIATGWLQQLRGAHFLTHTLWSAWLACAVLLALSCSGLWPGTNAA